jgi:riboflavin synthase alpha subunit
MIAQARVSRSMTRVGHGRGGRIEMSLDEKGAFGGHVVSGRCGCKGLPQWSAAVG